MNKVYCLTYCGWDGKEIFSAYSSRKTENMYRVLDENPKRIGVVDYSYDYGYDKGHYNPHCEKHIVWDTGDYSTWCKVQIIRSPNFPLQYLKVKIRGSKVVDQNKEFDGDGERDKLKAMMFNMVRDITHNTPIDTLKGRYSLTKVEVMTDE